MTTKQVTVTKFISCDGMEFGTRQECEAREREVRNLLEHDLWEQWHKKRELKNAINEARINARVALLDAQELKLKARSAMQKSEYCKLMANYYAYTSAYNVKRRELFEVRRKMSMTIDSLYMWFGSHKKKASTARVERRRRSHAWRVEHTPDQWRTPNKIRVSKLQHPAGEED